MNFLTNSRFIIIAAIICICSGKLSAQLSNSLYFMDRIPQSNQLNPAIQPLSNFYFGIPGANFEINVGNSAVGFSDIFIYKKELDSLVYPTYNEQTKSDFLGKLKETSYIYTDNRVDLLSFGFRIHNTYLSFNLTDRVEAYGYLPKDLIKFGLDFNGNSSFVANESFDISNLGFKAQWYREIGVGVSQQINPNFNFGFRAKLLFGIASMTTSNSTIQLNNTGVFEWQTRSTIDINSSIPGMNVYETNGKVDSTKFQKINSFSDARDLFLKSKNMGFAIDIGIVTQPVKNLSISASVVDLGFIRWTNNVHNYSQDGSFDFKGLDIDISGNSKVGQVLLDSLDKVYEIRTNQESYTTALTGKIYAGALYQLTKGIGFGALTRLQLVKNNIRPQFTFSLNLTHSQWFGTTLSYTIADGMFDNLGIGCVAKLGPLQWYFITDRIPLAYQKNSGSGPPIIPKYARSINLRSGFNIVFGSRRKIKVDKDKPFVEI
jgi:hypothetical protein